MGVTTQVNIRMPIDLKRALEEAAEESQQTVSKEIIQRLISSFFQETNKSAEYDVERQSHLATKKMLIATLTRGATIEIQGSSVADRVKYACQLLQVPIDDPDIQAMLEDITGDNVITK